MTAVSTMPLKRCSNVPASSSIANTTPASGVLNAAAMPAPPPARMKREIAFGSSKPRRLPTAYMMPAPTCTVGPSRPIDAPAARPSRVSPIFANTTGSDSSRSRNAVSGTSSAAMTWGMPLPRVARSGPEVSQASRAKAAGRAASGSHGDIASSERKPANARSLARAKAIAARPTSTPPPHSASRRFHSAGANNSSPSLRRRRVRREESLDSGMCRLSQRAGRARDDAAKTEPLQRILMPCAGILRATSKETKA